MNYLFILNDPPYGTERVFNALRLAHALMKRSDTERVDVFLMADAVVGAQAGQKTPDGFYNIERMLKRVIRAEGSRVLLCGTCMDARGIAEDAVVEGATRSSMDELGELTATSDKTLVF